MSLPDTVGNTAHGQSRQIRRADRVAEAREVSRTVYSLTRGEGFKRDFGLVDQMRRSAVSVMSNIAEGFERGGAADFHRFLFMAKGSCAELRSQLYVALDAGHIDQAAFDGLYLQIVEFGKVLGGLRVAIEKRKLT